MLLSTGAAPVWAQFPATEPLDDNPIIVTGYRDALEGIAPDRSLDADEVDSYGVSTVGELFEQVLAEAGDNSEETVVLVNGERVTDLNDVSDYPVEAVTRVDVLPRGSAARVGGPAHSRVVNIILRNNLGLFVLTGAHRIATGGEWTADRAEITRSHIRGPRRLNFTLKARREDRLLESERNILQPEASRPFDIFGNVIRDPRGIGGEIDPALSLLAGSVVTRAAVPIGLASPSLLDFADNADRINETDIGLYRSLRPETHNLEFGLSAADRFAPWLRATLQAQLRYDESKSLLGLAAGLFLLPQGGQYSPFSRDVAIAAYGSDPLRQRSRGWFANVATTLNADVGNWQLSFTGNFNRSERRFMTERQSRPQSELVSLAGFAGSPFTGTLDQLLDILADISRTAQTYGNAQFRAVGSPFDLPAGQVTLTVGAGLNSSDVVALNQVTGRRRYHRLQTDIFANGEVPLASRRANFLGDVGELSATFEFGLTDVSDFETLSRYSYGLNWIPEDRFRIIYLEDTAQRAPAAGFIGEAAVVTPSVRYFDFLTGQTVDVTQISGGNSALLAERSKTTRFAITAGPFEPINLRLNGEYLSTVTRNSISSLPPASAAILLAFPERFLRDPAGTLSTVDIRSVNFARERLEQLRYGFNLAVPLGRATVGPAPRTTPEDSSLADDGGEEGLSAGSVPAALRSRLRFQLAAYHTILLNNEVVIRPSLPTIDLLSGGATGIGGAPSRHQVNVLMTLGTRGLGTVLSAVWRSRTDLLTSSGGSADELRFAPLTTVNLRAFAAGTRLFPGTSWLRGTRFSLSVANLLNDRQNVRSLSGTTPLRYQPAYRDPLGRTIEIEIRKTF